MALNSNNYIGTELEWTEYTDHKLLPLETPIVFKTPDGKLRFGRVFKNTNSTILIVDGHFHFDVNLKDAVWSSLDFIFNEQSGD